MRSVIRWTVNNMPAMNTLVAAVLLLGAFCFYSMRREVFPEFELEIVLVTVPYPGATPEEVEEGICQKVEEACRSVGGFKTLSRQLAPGHAHGHPVRWGCPVEICGQPIAPGQLVHADQHGFLAIPPEDEAGLLEATAFMDANECDTLIGTARAATGLDMPELIARLEQAAASFGAKAADHFARGDRGGGEWASS
jgi:hypothetical protein